MRWDWGLNSRIIWGSQQQNNLGVSAAEEYGTGGLSSRRIWVLSSRIIWGLSSRITCSTLIFIDYKNIDILKIYNRHARLVLVFIIDVWPVIGRKKIIEWESVNSTMMLRLQKNTLRPTIPPSSQARLPVARLPFGKVSATMTGLGLHTLMIVCEKNN